MPDARIHNLSGCWSLDDEAMAAIERGEFDSLKSRAVAFAGAEDGGLDSIGRPAWVMLSDKLAAVPITGAIGIDDSFMGMIQGFRSADDVVKAIDGATASTAETVVVFFDMPGGAIAASTPLVGAMLRLRASGKRSVSFAGPGMTSLAYWFGCLADEIVCDPAAMVGQIGAAVAHVDYTEAESKAGIMTFHHVTGKKKLTRGVPITADNFQPSIDHAEANFSRFVATVAEARGISEKTVRDLEGAFFHADAAVAIGLADRVMPLEDLIQELHDSPASAGTQRAARLPISSSKGATAMADDDTKKTDPDPETEEKTELESLRAELEEKDEELESLRAEFAALKAEMDGKEEDEEKPAAYAALKSEFPDAAPDFLVACLDQNLGIARARRVNNKAMAAANAELLKTVAQMGEKLEKLSVGGTALSLAGGGGGSGDGGDFQEKVAALMTSDNIKDKTIAMGKCARKYPKAHAAWIAVGAPAIAV